MRPSGGRKHTTLRIEAEVMKEVKRFAVSHRRTPSAIIALALKEWTDMQRFPGIDYRWTYTGREAHVMGTGLTVREMWMIWKDHGRSWARIKKGFPQFKQAQVEAAVAYGRVYPEEVTPFEEAAGLTVVRV